MKKTLAIILSLLIIIPSFMLCVSAANALTDNYFGGGKIPKPMSSPYVVYSNDSSGNTVTTVWVFQPGDLSLMSTDIDKNYGFIEENGFTDIRKGVQIDVSFDDGRWLSESGIRDYSKPLTSAGSRGSEKGFITTDSSLNITTASNFLSIKQSDLSAYSPNEAAYVFLKPYVKTGSVNTLDIANHKIAYRYRWYIAYSVEGGSETDFDGVIFSDWSDSSSVGKGGTQKVPNKPSIIPTPRINNVVIYPKGGKNVVKYDIKFTDDIYEDIKYLTAVENLSEPYAIEARVRINGGEWKNAYTDFPIFIYSGTRYAEEQGWTLNENDKVELEVRIATIYGTHSEWINTNNPVVNPTPVEPGSNVSPQPSYETQNDPVPAPEGSEKESGSETGIESGDNNSGNQNVPGGQSGSEEGNKDESKCPVCGICPQPLGICLFILIGIVICAAAIVAAVVIIIKKKKK